MKPIPNYVLILVSPPKVDGRILNISQRKDTLSLVTRLQNTLAGEYHVEKGVAKRTQNNGIPTSFEAVYLLDLDVGRNALESGLYNLHLQKIEENRPDVGLEHPSSTLELIEAVTGESYLLDVGAERADDGKAVMTFNLRAKPEATGLTSKQAA
jgi:hypothetical protein